MKDPTNAPGTASCRDNRCDLLCVDAPRAEEIRRALPSVEEAEEAAERARALSDPADAGLRAAGVQGAVRVRPGLDLRPSAEPGLPPHEVTEKQ